jgi:cytochrome c oxidase subunit 4
MAERVITDTTYLLVLVGLLILTASTYGAARLDLGRFNFITAMIIAGAKASFVVLYFMHARYSSRLTRIVIGAGLAWLAILLTLTLSDYLTRVQF